MEFAVGVDIGGNKIKAGLVSVPGKVIKRYDISTESGKGKAAVLSNIFRAIDSVICKEAKFIGVGVAGQVSNGKILYCSNINDLNSLNLKKILEKRYKLNVVVENDARCFALGETIYGAAKKRKYAIGITLGTGVGSSIIIDKKPYYGTGNASEAGHTIINFDGICKGEAEDYLSSRWFNMVSHKTPKELFELARRRDKKARSVFNNYGRILGIFLINMILTFDPDCIVIGGNISNSWKYFSRSMNSEIKKRALFNHAKIVRRRLGDDAAVLGAVFLASNK
jgi:glucokinase